MNEKEIKEKRNREIAAWLTSKMGKTTLHWFSVLFDYLLLCFLWWLFGVEVAVFFALAIIATHSVEIKTDVRWIVKVLNSATEESKDE